MESAQIRNVAIGMFKLNTNLKRMILRATWLSLNAEVACGHLGKQGDAFSVVAKEMRFMMTRLDLLIKDMETVFLDMNQLLGEYARLEKSLNYQIEGFKIYRKEAMTKVAHQEEQGQESQRDFFLTNCKIMETRVDENTSYFKDQDRLVGQYIKKVRKSLDNLSWVAVRQSRFISIFGRVESARMDTAGSTHNLAAVASDVVKLADDLTDVELEARNYFY